MDGCTPWNPDVSVTDCCLQCLNYKKTLNVRWTNVWEAAYQMRVKISSATLNMRFLWRDNSPVFIVLVWLEHAQCACRHAGCSEWEVYSHTTSAAAALHSDHCLTATQLLLECYYQGRWSWRSRMENTEEIQVEDGKEKQALVFTFVFSLSF